MPSSEDGTTQRWFLSFADSSGRPWGDGTGMAARAGSNPPLAPWATGCKVTPLIGGFAAMRDVRETLRAAIAEVSTRKNDIGKDLGYVYLTSWRLNPLRDISESNSPWATGPGEDPTILGWILKLMQAGIRVRLCLWLPVMTARLLDFESHILEHHWVARTVQRENERLMKQYKLNPDQDEPFGITALDMRVTNLLLPSASHHQKMMVIRVGSVQVAYVGGVDLAYTRRDGPDSNHPFNPTVATFMAGDRQSGEHIVAPSAASWPKDTKVDYSSVKSAPNSVPPNDLPSNVYGSENQIWHDQHLRLEGPIVEMIDTQFCERWCDTASELVPNDVGFPEPVSRVFSLAELGGAQHIYSNQVIFSTPAAFSSTPERAIFRPISRFPTPPPPPSVGNSLVQMWRTIPLRAGRSKAPLMEGEFTVMAGIANAVKAANELIWIFDQYFWSRAFTRLLRKQIETKPGLHVIIILPPHADTQVDVAHRARQLAFDTLYSLLNSQETARIGFYSLWDPKGKVGIYCHAKTQIYDGALLVCGSANLNRRSFLCDTELDCAVLDSSVVARHQQALWELLFPSTPYPNVDLNIKGNGKVFFDKFKAAAPTTMSGAPIPGSHLIWGPISPYDVAELPTSPPVIPPVSKSGFIVGPIFEYKYNHALDPISIAKMPENRPLDEVTDLLEAPAKRKQWRRL